jgi:peptide/nickel transport system permease protein
VTWYLVRRSGQAVAVVIGVMILTFIMIHMEPGSVARSILGFRATPGRIALFNSTYGLNEPLYKQFVTYLSEVAHGNLGTSYYLQQPVMTLVAQRLPKDIVLLGLATVLALIIALPLGIYQAVRRNRLGDNMLSGVTFTLYSMPDFFFAIALIAVFAVQLHVLPPEAPQAATVGGMLADERM